MINFNFENYTKLIFGKDKELTVGQEVKKFSNKILMHYGGGSIKNSGLYEKIVTSLKEANVEFIELSGVKPNPRLSLVREGIKLVRENKIDFILAVGGGSVIDSAKAISLGANYDGDVWDLFEKGKNFEGSCVPLGVVLTIPAAGSETSGGTVITNEDGGYKRSTGDRTMRPQFAIMNPELTYTLPDYQTACGACDMFAHILERYFTNVENVGLTDRLCEGAMKNIIENAKKVLENGNDYAARAEIMLSGTIAHNDSLSMGRIGDWASHDIEHELSGIYDIAHGAGLAIIFPAWMKYVYKHDINRFAQFANRVFDVEIDLKDLEGTALKGIEALKNFFKEIGLPVTLEDANISDDRLEEMAEKRTENGTVGNFVKLNKEDVLNIYKLAIK
ncbi:iron-containing alcohol dehydrogenase [Clostridium gasigenes]|uniref:iron-containing alcohol dehydrogenase n=1 Tax=Clostridium gasigenes TaxID=94869 RepID=UPI0014382D00|nr:iron-containing alcohol dehydrogenase [Clostridium gasigenes]NKF08652.1 iron-containing alcohol dehydrogenase [Clostridium gasigenes]QSW18438.1 iron-containing alcohol dehydrogenase [Clostridium gasigenes]